MPPFTVSAAGAKLAEIIDRVAVGKDRILIERGGEKLCAVVPAELLASLEPPSSESGSPAEDLQRVLAELARSRVLSSGNLGAALREITEAAAHALKLNRASVWRFDATRSKASCLDLFLADSGQHLDGDAFSPEAQPEFLEALEAARAIGVRDTRDDPRTRVLAAEGSAPLGLTTMLCAPIRIAGQMIGVAILGEARGKRLWTADEQAFVGSIGDLIALTLQGHQHRRAEQAIRDREERFRDIANVASDWFWESDQELCISYVSDRFLEVTGIARDRVLGRPIWEVMAVTADPGAGQSHVAALSRHRPFRDFRLETVDPLGHARTWSISGNPTFDDEDTFVGYRGSGTDVTHQVEMAQGLKAAKEAAELANRAKSEFLANMSHELRTPLNAIIGFSEMISQEVMGPINNAHYADYAADIHESGTHLLSLINDILDLSKIEAGKIELHEHQLDLREAIKATMRIIGERLRAANLRLEIDLLSPLPLLLADLRAVKQILLNLMSNAVKFTPDGGVIRVSGRVDRHGDMLISVSDSGIGMREEDLPTAMAPFGQIESSLNRRHQGSGLGLPLVRSLVELHGGSVEISSRIGAGTIVTVRLPKKRVVASAAAG